MANKQYAYINKDMLIWARGETPFVAVDDVIAKLPASSKITVGKLAEWESGTNLPSITEAKALAKAYDVPFACFYYVKPPEKKPRPYTDRRMLFGERISHISFDLWKEIRHIIANRELLIDSALSQVDLSSSLPAINHTDSVDIVAKRIRKVFGIETPFSTKSQYGSNAFNYFRKIVEMQNIMVAQLSGVAISEMRGFSIYYDAVPIIGINKNDWERAKVFTLFHEIAHLVRRSSSLCLVDFDDADDQEEKTCNSIAAAILLPELDFRNTLISINGTNTTIENEQLLRMADCFAVSTSVVLRRMFELNIIKRDYFNIRYDEISRDFNESQQRKKDDDKSTYVPYDRRYLSASGYLFPRIMLLSYSSGNISFGEMCRSLNIKAKHINTIEKVVMT